jgi:hypothetical protein
MVVDMTHMRILLLALSLGFVGGFSFIAMSASAIPAAPTEQAASR